MQHRYFFGHELFGLGNAPLYPYLLHGFGAFGGLHGLD